MPKLEKQSEASGRTVFDLLAITPVRIAIPTVILIIFAVALAWIIAHTIAAPGSKVSVFGLIEYNKFGHSATTTITVTPSTLVQERTDVVRQLVKKSEELGALKERLKSVRDENELTQLLRQVVKIAPAVGESELAARSAQQVLKEEPDDPDALEASESLARFQAIAQIYAVSNNTVTQSTGTFISKDGLLLVAYHAIAGSDRIMITANERTFKDVIVVAIDANRDLATLRIQNAEGPTAFLTLDDSLPKDPLSAHYEVLGFPRGLGATRLIAEIAHPDFVSTMSLRGTDGRRIYDVSFDIITLDVAVFNGMGGAPVLCDGRVIGIISGSLSEGRSLAWATPVKYLSGLQTVSAKVENMKWPKNNALRQHFR